jgi:pimeloyl-ACP methyl ester carboxylesterase
MPIPVLPIVVAVAALTLKSDTKPVTVFVKKPRGTLYWGGAGLDGSYIKPQLKAFEDAGISNISVGLTNSASVTLGPAGTLIDAIRSGLVIRFEDDAEWTISKGMDTSSGQFNLIGYSYGSLLAAQTANFYAKNQHIVDHLVLIGSPIDAKFLATLKTRRNIRKIVVIDLKSFGDPLYAGMTQLELLTASAQLGADMAANTGQGHFYYAHVVQDSKNRWQVLANRLFNEGLR